MIMALMMSRNRPRLITVIGIVMTMSSGFRVAFNRPKTIAIQTAVVKMSI